MSLVIKARLLTYHTTIFEKYNFVTILQGLLNFEDDVRTVPAYSEKNLYFKCKMGHPTVKYKTLFL